MTNGPLIIDLMHPMDVVLQFPTIGRVKDSNVDIPLWVKYDGKPYDLTSHRLGFYGRDAKGVAKIALQDPVGPAIEAGRVTFRMPGAAFKAAGQYEEAWFRVEKDGQLVSSLNVKFNVLENNVEFGVDDEPYYSDIEKLIAEFKTAIANSKNDALKIIAEYTQKFKDVNTDATWLIGQLDIIAAKIKSNDIATNSQLKQAVSDSTKTLMSEINQRPKNSDVVDMLKRGFANFDGGQPHAIVDAATLKKTYPSGHDGVFIAIDTGHMWMWGPNGEWIDGGAYQSTQIKDSSVDITKLAGNAQAPIFIPSRDGIPNYDSETDTFDFRCNTDSAYFMINNKEIQVPQPLTIKNSVFSNPATTSAKLIYDADSESFSFIGWAEKLGTNQTMIGGLRRGNEGWFWSGSMDITVDGKQVDQYNIAPNVLFSISNKTLPDFNTETRVFDFSSKKNTTATLVIGDRVIPIPEGTLATPTEDALKNNSLRIVFNLADSTAQVIAWDEETPAYCVTVAPILMNYPGHPLIMGGFPYTIDGSRPNTKNHNIDLVVSTDGAPIFNREDRSLNLNCYSDSAYMIYDGRSYQVPRDTIIPGNGDASASSIRYLFKPSTMEFKSVGWNEEVETGWVQIAAARITHNNDVLFTASFPIEVKGASSDNPLNAKIKGINHRGFNVVAPEESKSAYIISKRNGYHHWEGDINWTKDNVPMMIHDKPINRTARNLDGSQISGTVNITDLNYADLAKYDFGIVKGDRYKGEPLLTFEELVKLARYNNTFLHIEFKYEFTQEQVKTLHDTVVKYNMLDRIGWQAFTWDWLKPMMELEPNGQYELLGGDVTDGYFTKMAALKTETNTIIASQDASRSVADIQKIADKGYPIYLWTVDDGDTVRKFRDIGMVEGIMTNGAINVADELTK